MDTNDGVVCLWFTEEDKVRIRGQIQGWWKEGFAEESEGRKVWSERSDGVCPDGRWRYV